MDHNDMENKKANLFTEFPPVTTSEWEQKITEDLKGADYDKKLRWKTCEGFTVKPYYRSEDIEKLTAQTHSLPGEFPYVRTAKTTGNAWEICQEIIADDATEANKAAIEACARGANALILNARSLTSAENVAILLNGINLHTTSLHFHASRSYIPFIGYLKQGIALLGADPLKVRGSVDFDPISYLVLNGNYHYSQAQDMDEAVDMVDLVSKELPNFRAITINGQYFHNAGSTLVQEVAFSLASAHEYLAWITSKGGDAAKAASGMVFTFATGSNYFMEIAKLRAARILWAHITQQYLTGSESAGRMLIHSITANWNKTIYDPYVNVLRTATESMSAAIGGADMITVLPFDLNYKEPDTFSERIARNQQIILKEESHLDKVIDPASGSYYLESITDSMAAAAWKLFTEVEEKGGMLKAIETGFVQSLVNESRAQKMADIASRKTIVLGTNQYPFAGDQMLDKIQAEESEYADAAAPGQPAVFKTIEILRGADQFEDLRLATEIWESEGNARPKVFLLTYGNLAMRKARAGFSTNFFGCAGYTVIDNSGFATVKEGVDAALAAKAEIVVLCSSDEEYTDNAAEAAKALKSANTQVQVVLAGYPKELVDALKTAGVDEFIHVRTNVYESLYSFQQKMGVML